MPKGGKGKPQKHVPEPEESEEEEEDFQGMMIDPATLAKLMNPKEFATKFVNDLPTVVRRRVHALKGMQSEWDELYKAYQEELAQLEEKYEKMYKPLYDKRKDIVQGVYEPENSEVEKGTRVVELDDETSEKKADEEKPEEKKAESKDEPAAKGIPEFWLNAFKNQEAIEETITEKDEDALKYLTDVSSRTFSGEEKKGFELTFTFDPNPYFEDTVLTKRYYLVEEDEIILDNVEGCPIKWKAGKNLTVVIKQKKQRHKGGKQTRTIKEEQPCDSFFSFFSPPKMPSDAEQTEEDEMDECEDAIEHDYDVGRAIKDKIIPRAVQWYTGEAIPSGGHMLSGDAFEEEDDEEEEEEGAKPKPKSIKENKPKGAEAKQQQECNQQ